MTRKKVRTGYRGSGGLGSDEVRAFCAPQRIFQSPFEAHFIFSNAH